MSTINETDKNQLFRCGNKTLDQRKTEYYAKHDLITKQAEHIKVLRSALEDINYELRANDCDDLGWVIRKSFEALESTKD